MSILKRYDKLRYVKNKIKFLELVLKILKIFPNGKYLELTSFIIKEMQKNT